MNGVDGIRNGGELAQLAGVGYAADLERHDRDAELNLFLRSRARGGQVAWQDQKSAAELFGLSIARVEEAILSLTLLPARYQRNRQAISVSQQLRLFRSRVAVIGCGGLGGYAIEQLARLGVGTIVAVDHDSFVEHNLNRQLFSYPELLGRSKVAAARSRIAAVNPAVTVVPWARAFTRKNGAGLLGGSQVAVDALDSVDARLDLAEVCADLTIPMVHGAIGGWYGQVATQFPGERTVQRIFAHPDQRQGVEVELGNPAFAPGVVASLQVAEVCKILLGVGVPLRNRKLTVDLWHMDIEEIPLPGVNDV